MTMANIFDLILLAVLIIIAVGYVRKGFVAGLVQFLGKLASLVGAVLISQYVAPLLFSRFFENSLVERVEGMVEAEGAAGTQQLIETYAGFLPVNVKQSLFASVESLMNHMGGTPEFAARVVDEVVAPLFTPIIAFVVFFVAFALCRMLVSFTVAVLTNLNRIPVVGGVNKTLGLAMGLLAGTVDLYLVLCGVWAVIVITGGSIAFLNDAALADSIAYTIFGRINPFA